MCFQFLGLRGFALSRRRLEKLLKAAIDQGADFIADDDTGPFRDAWHAACILQHGGYAPAADTHASAIGRRKRETGGLRGIESFLKGRLVLLHAAEEHVSIIGRGGGKSSFRAASKPSYVAHPVVPDPGSA